jgi:hypothetical protein
LSLAEPAFRDEPLLPLLAACPLFSGLPEHMLRSARYERRLDRHAVASALLEHQPASSARADEISGHGSYARWVGRWPW